MKDRDTRYPRSPARIRGVYVSLREARTGRSRKYDGRNHETSRVRDRTGFRFTKTRERVNPSSHDVYHLLKRTHIVVIHVGLRQPCGESDTAFLFPLRHNAAQGVFVRSSVTRQFAATVGAAPILGDLREEDFHLSSSHPGLRCVGSRRRAYGHPGSGQATS